MVLTQKPNLQRLIKTIWAPFRLLFPRNMIDCSPSWRGRNEYRARAVNLISVQLLTVGTLIRSRLRETKTQKGCKRVIVCNGTRLTKEFYSQSFSYSVTKMPIGWSIFWPADMGAEKEQLFEFKCHLNAEVRLFCIFWSVLLYSVILICSYARSRYVSFWTTIRTDNSVLSSQSICR